MKRYLPLLWIALAGCAPHYKSGQTQCSDKKECPSGYSCSDDGTTAVHYCVDNTTLGCPKGATFYCSQSNSCWISPVACSTVVGLDGGSGATSDAAIRRDGGTTDGTVVGTPDALDAGNKDTGSASSCTPACSSTQECLSGQCCAPPAAGGDCTTFPACGCPSGKVCYPSSTTHALACFTSNNLAAGADCSGGSTCQSGYGCFGSICKQYCASNTDCPAVGGVQSCDQTTWSSDQTDITGVKACERVCDPAHPQNPTSPLLACPTGFNCVSDQNGISYCLKASPLAAGSTCTQESDCQAGYYCTTSGACNRYCLSSADCSTGTTCQFSFSPAEYAGSYKVGYCN